MSSSDLHECYIKKDVYIGNPNQTRHLNDHHRRMEPRRKGRVPLRSVLCRIVLL